MSTRQMYEGALNKAAMRSVGYLLQGTRLQYTHLE